MESNKSFSLCLIGFNEQQTETFLAVFSLAEKRLMHTWTIIKSSQADFFLFSVEKSEAEQFILEKNIPFSKCIFCTEKNTYTNNELSIDKNKIPRIQSLIIVLNQLTNNDNTRTENTVLNKTDFFIPEQSLLKHLLYSNEERLLWTYKTSENYQKIYINLIDNCYYSTSDLKSLDLCLEDETTINIQVITKELWNKELATLTLNKTPLHNLIWYLTIQLSKGRLLKNHLGEDNIYLNRWPDLNISNARKYTKLAAFMRNNAVYLTEVSNKTGIPLSEVYNFYNACYLIGITEKSEEQTRFIKTIDEEKQKLLDKINNRLLLFNK